MLALVEFAGSRRLRQMAETLLNKSFFMLAMQSFRGAHGSTHGRCYVEGLKSARVENTSGLGRIAWGMGMFNGETRATGMLALAKTYRVPQILQDIAAEIDTSITTEARSQARFRPQFDMRGDAWDVRTRTRRTAHYMLSAALDYQPGERGVQEHLWQATLSPEAVVFTNYPGNNMQHGHARPNFWAGSASLPRVMLDGRTLLCLYDIQPDLGLGFAHAYFPTAAFDEWYIAGQWAFARCGSGYVGLWADGELRLTQRGQHAGQELRSVAGGAAWVCHVGSADEDGSFETFQNHLLATAPTYENRRIRCGTLDRTDLQMGWGKPIMVNGVETSLSDFPHYRNAYTDTAMGADEMIIRHGDQTLTLDLMQGSSH